MTLFSGFSNIFYVFVMRFNTFYVVTSIDSLSNSIPFGHQNATFYRSIQYLLLSFSIQNQMMTLAVAEQQKIQGSCLSFLGLGN